mgnify:CR=1 FL=1
MTPKEYKQMMAHLTRPAMARDGRIGFDKGGVAQVKAYVESLPKNTVVTRKLVKDFIEANDVNVNFENLFNKKRPAYVGNFIKDKSITIDASKTPDKFKKARAIINDPKKLKEFLKYGNQKGVSIKDIRKKFNISNEEFYDGGLRNLFDKDFQLQASKKIKPKTINNINTLLNDKQAFNFLKKGQIVPDEIITKLKLAPSEAATATVRIGQIYGGNDFGIDEFKKIRKNVKTSDKLFDTMNKFQFGNPYRSKLYKTSLELIDQQLGNEKGTFESLKKKASYILKKNKIKGFDINEIAGVTGTARTGVGEFSQFVDIMDSNLNQKQMASFQSAFSQARQNIMNNPNVFAKESKRINRLAGIFEKEYGVELPRIRALNEVEKFYSPTRLKQLSDQGLDIKAASKKLGYTVQMPKSAVTIQEFVKQTPKAVRGLAAFIKRNFPELKCSLSKGVNCNDPQAYQKSLNELSKKAAQGDQTAKTTLSKFGNKVATAGRFIKGALGPLALATEVAIDLALPLNETLSKGVPFKQAFADTLINKYILGPKLQVDKEAEIAKEMAKGEEFAMAERGRRMMIPQSATADAQRLKKREQQMEQAFPTTSPQEIDEILKTQGMTIQDFGITYPQAQDFIKQDQQMQAIADAGGIANLAGGGIAKEAGDSSGPPPESGPNSQGLPGLLKRVKKL